MKLLQFAVASIVDANTGYGLAKAADIDYIAAEKRGRSIRSHSVIALLNLLKQRLADVVASYRESAAQRKQLGVLARLDDRVLQDIGFTRADITAVELGQINFDALEASRRVNLSPIVSNCAKLVRIDALAPETSAINEAVFASSKCA